MKKKLLLLSAIFAAFLLNVAGANAQAPKAVSDSGLLYEITGKNLKKPSYLFGTIHLICQKDMIPAEKLQSYVDKTGQLMLEINLNDQAEMLKAAQGMTLAGGKSTKDYLKPEEYAKLDEVFKNYLGVSYDRFQTFKPLMATTVLLMSPKGIGCQAVPGYDKVLADAATANKMPIIGLETVDAQFAAVDAQPLAAQIEALNKLAADPEKSFADFKKLYQIYLAQNSDELYDLTAAQFKADGTPQDKLLDERNTNWIPIIEKNIAVTPSFIAVGGGHLGGAKGVINQLRERGYKVTPIKL